MKFAAYWTNNFHYDKDISELIIIYRDQKIKNLLKFLSDHENQKISIEIDEPNDNIIEILSALPKYNIVLRLSQNFWRNKYREAEKTFMEQCKKAKVLFYFTTLIDSWGSLIDAQYAGASEVIISGELGFDLERVSNYCHGAELKIRCIPNFCQPTYYEEDPLYSFWIRPEDVIYYEQKSYIDILEFFYTDKYPDKRINSDFLYETYVKSQYWKTDLAGLIIGFEPGVNNTYIMPPFTKHRAVCRKKCIKGERCRFCTNYYDMSKELENNYLVPSQYVDFLEKK